MKKSDIKEYTLQSDFNVAGNPPPGADRKAIEIIDYRAEHQIYFEAFNRAWI